MTDTLCKSTLEIEKLAADWLANRDRDDWNAEDQIRLDHWLTESPAHEIAYWRLEVAWARTARLAALHRPVQGSSQSPNQRWPFWTRIAAVLGLVTVTGFIGSYYSARPHERVFSTGIGGHKRVTLADGSLVELNTDTVIRLTASGPARTVFLDKGEAYFQIVHDTAHPFVVIAGSHRVTDIGTAFIVRREPHQLDVSLVEGVARFDAPKDHTFKAIELRPGDEVIATAEGVSRKKKPMVALTKELGWRQGTLIFDGTTLSEAAAEFNRYNQTKVVIASPKAAQLTINGTFQANNVQAFVDAAQVVLGVKFQTRNREIVISQ